MTGRVLVTGATGFLGQALLRRLGARAIGQGRDAGRLAALRQQGFDTVQWCLPEAAPQEPILQEVTAIVHCAALSSPFGPAKAFQQANVAGTQAVLDFAQKRGVKRFVYVSSPSIYFALADQLHVAEDMPLPRPFNAYAASKVAAEHRVLGRPDLGPIIIRPRGLYGAGDTALLPRLLRTAKERALPRFRDGRACIDLTYVEDVVDSLLAALDAGAVAEGKAFNVSGGEVLPISDIVQRVCDKAKTPLRWRKMPLRPALIAAGAAEQLALLRPGQPEPLVTRYGLGLFAYEQSLDISRAAAVLGWRPKVRFAEGLERTFAEGIPR